MCEAPALARTARARPRSVNVERTLSPPPHAHTLPLSHLQRPLRFRRTRALVSATINDADTADTVSGAPQLVLSASAALEARSLAYAVPRVARDISAGVPTVGPPAARDALAALRNLMTVPTAPGAVAVAGAVGAGLARANKEAGVSVARAACSVLAHAALTPGESEARVHALVARLKDLTDYDFTPPLARA